MPQVRPALTWVTFMVHHVRICLVLYSLVRLAAPFVAPDACLTPLLLLQSIAKDVKLTEMHAAAELFEPRVEYAFSYLQVFSAICVIFAHGEAPAAVSAALPRNLCFQAACVLHVALQVSSKCVAFATAPFELEPATVHCKERLFLCLMLLASLLTYPHHNLAACRCW